MGKYTLFANKYSFLFLSEKRKRDVSFWTQRPQYFYYINIIHHIFYYFNSIFVLKVCLFVFFLRFLRKIMPLGLKLKNMDTFDFSVNYNTI